MESHVTCTLCNETISYAPCEVWKVSYHLQEKHFKDNVGYFFAKDDGRNELCYKVAGKKRKMYKTTVETWNRGSVTLYCFRCKKSGPPLIRKQRNKVARSSFGALCLLGCWPICFLPFMVGKRHIVDAYCKECGLLLGSIDMKSGAFQQAQSFMSVDVPKICVDCVA